MVADASRDLISSDAVRAIANVHRVEEGTFSVVPFFPDNFIIHCRSRETRDRILGASAVPAAGTFLVLRTWARLAQANAMALKFKVNIELEGVPAHV